MLLLSAHLGSFDALRVLSLRNPDVSIRILLDVGQNAGLSDVLNTLNPKLASTIIDARRPGPALVLDMQQALRTQRHRVDAGGSAASRQSGHRRQLPRRARRFPGLALVVRERAARAGGAGLRSVSRRQALRPAFRDVSPSSCRAIAANAPRRWPRWCSASRTGWRTSRGMAPYNWFNLYDFWDAALAPNHPPGRTAADGHGSRVAALKSWSARCGARRR